MTMYIDGFIVKVQRPDNAGDVFFCRPDGNARGSINVQYITDKFGRSRPLCFHRARFTVLVMSLLIAFH